MILYDFMIFHHKECFSVFSQVLEGTVILCKISTEKNS